jgi:hypothetical protein
VDEVSGHFVGGRQSRRCMTLIPFIYLKGMRSEDARRAHLPTYVGKEVYGQANRSKNYKDFTPEDPCMQLTLHTAQVLLYV